MMPSGVFLRSLLLCLVLALGNAQEACDSNFVLMKNNKKVQIDETCETVPCLIKCCAESQILFVNGTDADGFCESTSYLEKTYDVSNLEDYSGLEIYSNYTKRESIKTKKNISDFTIIHYENFIICDFRQYIFFFQFPVVLEDGTMELWQKLSETGDIQLFGMGEFCFENTFNGTLLQTEIYLKVKNPNEEKEKEKEERAVIVANCMMMSCVFTVLVLVVYSLLKELRNLAGLMLMAYVATFTAFCLLRSVHVYAYTYYYHIMDTQMCIIFTLLVYYSLLSSFCWMNIMSFDIWWTLRATRKYMKTNRRGILVKFAWYGLYAWGAPLLATAFVVAADLLDLPGVIKPQVFVGGGCFFGDYPHRYYVSCSIALLVSANIVWFLLTAYNICRVRRTITQYDKDTREKNKHNETRFLLYVKLSLLMGICRIFDAINEDHWIVYVIDLLNACSGLYIFILFVCKRKILHLLCVKFSIDDKRLKNWSFRSTRSTLFTSSQTQSTKSEQRQPRGDNKLPTA